MKNSLKDYFFFNKKDKVAFILLLLLIALGGIYAIYLNNFSIIDPTFIKNQIESEATFNAYEESLEPVYLIDGNSEIEEEVIEKSTSKKKKRSSNKNKKLVEGNVVNINKASITTLMRIPGIGSTIAERIVQYRDSVGEFENIEELKNIKGITNNKL